MGLSSGDFGPASAASSGGGADGGNIIVKLFLDASNYVKGLAQAKEAAEGAAASTQDSFEKAFQGASQEVKLFGRLLQTDMKDNQVSLEQAFASLRDGVKGLGVDGKRDAEGMTEAFRRMGGQVKTAGVDLSQFLKTAGRIVGITSLVSLLAKAFQGLVGIIRDSIQEFQEYTFEVFRLDVAVRATQRRFGEAIGTTEEWRDFIMQLREQFRIFSTKDLTAATSKVILLTRELGFNREQTESVIQASIVLAEVTGVKVEEAARRLTLFLDTGYSRGLALLGLQVNKTTVEQQALTEGIDKSWNEMTRAERAAVGLNAVLAQTAPLLEDAGKAADTFQGRMMEMQAAQSDAMLEIGQGAAFVRLAWEQIKTFVITDLVPGISNAIARLARGVVDDLEPMVRSFATFVSFMTQFIEAMKAGFTDFNFGEVMAQAMEDGARGVEVFRATIERQFFPTIESMGNVADDEMGSLADSFEEGEEAAQDFADAVSDAVDKIEDEFRRFGQAQEDAFRRFQQDMEDLNRDFAFDLIDLYRDLGQKLQDIDRKSLQKREDIIADSRLKEQDIWMKANEDVAQAQIQFRFEEIRDQRRFNLEMAQLQREFLFELEDAVRERDARQVLMLMRRNNLERQRRQEDFDNRRNEAGVELSIEIEQIRRAAQIRINEERRALQQRLADNEQARLRARAQARIAFQRDLQELMLEHQRRREQEQLDYNRRLEDLRIYHQRRLAEIGRTLAMEVKGNAEAARAVVSIWAGAYSQIVAFMNAFNQAAGQFGGQAASAAGAAIGSTSPFSRSQRELEFAGRFQHGGSVVARKPTLAMFGEAGPELGSFIPMNRLGQQGQGGGGRMGLDITVRTEEGLMAEITEQVMGEVADVIISSEREARR